MTSQTNEADKEPLCQSTIMSKPKGKHDSSLSSMTIRLPYHSFAFEWPSDNDVYCLLMLKDGDSFLVVSLSGGGEVREQENAEEGAGRSWGRHPATCAEPPAGGTVGYLRVPHVSDADSGTVSDHFLLETTTHLTCKWFFHIWENSKIESRVYTQLPPKTSWAFPVAHLLA